MSNHGTGTVLRDGPPLADVASVSPAPSRPAAPVRRTSPYLASPVKRCVDVVGAAAILVALAPVLLAVALAIRIESPGPALFVQWRTGLGGRHFRIYKFRSMRAATTEERRQASREDRRVTSIGRHIRAWSVDELPQLVNVLKGDMSLVGPRPHPVYLDDAWRDLVPGYDRRFAARPGITGMSQASGLRGETGTPKAVRARVAVDLKYVRCASFSTDLRIAAATVAGVLRRNNAY